MKDERNPEDVLHLMDIEAFSKASEEERREMVREMLVAIARKKGSDGER